MTTPAAQAQAALLHFARNGRLEDRAYSATHELGESPHDSNYRVFVTLSASYSRDTKAYAVRLAVSETRYEGGQVSLRHEREMPHKRLGEYSATRFSAKRAETLYNEALAALRADPTPLVELLTAESERS
ncbi:hypothetical protein J2X12_002864 [Pseudarthrobacter oxydans]|uniref:Uncharacterized protein n=1 Tax=Pseudarthrobacter oxydans TaxID=1671 RepID=A0AAW8NCR4_PSEOX|nr:hypothetical protein [Pseudarthrobacter oxydans]MDR6794853.1 hypothetical protein [Pseudarthrobacter oxydans]MDR7164826.1 hypothetical protein [Pseudarthrobacter oxydans]